MTAVEPGLRDTVHVRGNESATILSHFENPGQWMVHCHIEHHMANGMMTVTDIRVAINAAATVDCVADSAAVPPYTWLTEIASAQAADTIAGFRTARRAMCRSVTVYS